MSCSKIEESQVLISIEGEKNSIISYSFGSRFPTEGGYKITKEPKHAQSSFLGIIDNETKYEYESDSSFAGEDFVEITRSHSNGGMVFSKTIYSITVIVN